MSQTTLHKPGRLAVRNVETSVCKQLRKLTIPAQHFELLICTNLGAVAAKLLQQLLSGLAICKNLHMFMASWCLCCLSLLPAI
jgi:hypothetical protein